MGLIFCILSFSSAIHTLLREHFVERLCSFCILFMGAINWKENKEVATTSLEVMILMKKPQIFLEFFYVYFWKKNILGLNNSILEENKNIYGNAFIPSKSHWNIGLCYLHKYDENIYLKAFRDFYLTAVWQNIHGNLKHKLKKNTFSISHNTPIKILISHQNQF